MKEVVVFSTGTVYKRIVGVDEELSAKEATTAELKTAGVTLAVVQVPAVPVAVT